MQHDRSPAACFYCCCCCCDCLLHHQHGSLSSTQNGRAIYVRGGILHFFFGDPIVSFPLYQPNRDATDTRRRRRQISTPVLKSPPLPPSPLPPPPPPPPHHHRHRHREQNIVNSCVGGVSNRGGGTRTANQLILTYSTAVFIAVYLYNTLA